MLRFQEAGSDLWRIVKEPTNELVIDQGAGNIDFTFSTSGDFTVHDGDVIIETGGIKGPSVLYIDPATYDTDSDAGSAAGTVRIRGDLIVDGDTTTINSTTLTVDDLNIVLASGAADSATADGAGITIDGADATLTYVASGDNFNFNKNVDVTGTVTSDELRIENTANARLFLKADTDNIDESHVPTIFFGSDGGENNARIGLIGDNDSEFIGSVGNYAYMSTTGSNKGWHFATNDILRMTVTQVGDVQFRENNGGTPQVGMHWDYADGRLGIGYDDPGKELDIQGTIRSRTSNNVSNIILSDDGNGNESDNTISRDAGIVGIARDTTQKPVMMIHGRFEASDNIINIGGMSTHTASNWDGTGVQGATKIQLYTASAVNTETYSATDPTVVITPQTLTIDSGSSGDAAILSFVNDNERTRITSNYDTGGGGRLGIWTDTAGGTLLQRMTIDNEGNVGIGTSSPVNRLHVDSSNGASSWTNTLYRGVHISDDIGGRLILEDTGGDTDAKTFVMVSENGEFRIHAASDDGTSWVQNKAFMIKHATGALHGSQVRHSIRPTLNLDFANSKELDPRITFYRNSMGSYYNESGILEFASHNEPRFDHNPITGESKGLLIEKAATNLYKNSILGKDWGPINAILRLYNAKSPDGKMNAHTFIQDTSTGQHYLTMGGSYPVSSGQRYTWSFYAKAAGLNRISWTTGGGFAYSYARFELTGDGSNSLTNIPSDDWSITSVGSGWYRCTVTMTANASTNASFYLDRLTLNSGTGDGVSGFHIYGVQFEQNEFATSYIPSVNSFVVRSSKATYIDKDGTVKTAPRDTLRYSHKWDGRQYVETGPLFENTSTNLVNNSDFQSNWAFPNAGYSYATEVIAPDGTTIQAVSKNTTYQLIRQGGIWDNVNYTGPITVSYWAKAISSTGNEVVGHDLGDLPNSFVHSVTSDWVRYEHTHYVTAGSTIYDFVDFGLNENTEVAIWGVQVEEQNYATSYIPSEVSSSQQSSSTRAADVVNKLEHARDMDQGRIYDISDFYNTQEYKGTLYREISFNESLKRAAAARANTSFYNTAVGQDQIILRVVTDTSAPYLDSTGYNISGTQWDLGNRVVTGVNQIHKQAVSFEDNNVTGAVNGVSSSSDNDADVPLVTSLQILTGDTTACIKKIVYYPEALTNAQVVALTEND
jgi:hypothetical protein